MLVQFRVHIFLVLILCFCHFFFFPFFVQFQNQTRFHIFLFIKRTNRKKIVLQFAYFHFLAECFSLLLNVTFFASTGKLKCGNDQNLSPEVKSCAHKCKLIKSRNSYWHKSLYSRYDGAENVKLVFPFCTWHPSVFEDLPFHSSSHINHLIMQFNFETSLYSLSSLALLTSCC